MGRKKINLLGKTFGLLLVVKETDQKVGGSFLWHCSCKCGNTKLVSQGNLVAGNVRSCGCLAVKMTIERSTTHGQTKTPLYQRWVSMRKRCLSPRHRAYKNYGGRGIKICKRWDSFENFREDLEESFSDHVHKFGTRETWIERVNNDGNYEPRNVKWATKKEQSRNTRFSQKLTFDGKTQTISAWAEELKMSKEALGYRIRAGWPLKKALTKPLN